jgi:hypothetical protein
MPSTAGSRKMIKYANQQQQEAEQWINATIHSRKACICKQSTAGRSVNVNHQQQGWYM